MNNEKKRKKIVIRIPALQIGIVYLILFTWIEMALAWDPNPAYCKMDFIINILSRIKFFILFFPPTIFVFLFSSMKDFNLFRVSRLKSRRNIWRSQVKRSLIHSVILATVFMLVALGCLPNEKNYNWDVNNSVYAFLTGGTLKYPAIVVLLIIYFCILLELFLIQSILLLSLWWKNTCTYGVILVCMIKISEVGGFQYGIIVNRIIAGYRLWSHPWKQVIGVTFIGLFVLIMWMLYKLLVGKKEFLRV